MGFGYKRTNKQSKTDRSHVYYGDKSYNSLIQDVLPCLLKMRSIVPYECSVPSIPYSPGNPSNLQWRRYFSITKNCNPNCNKESEPAVLVPPPPRPKPCLEEEEVPMPQPIGFLKKRIICKPKPQPQPKPIFLKRVPCVCRKKRSVFGPEAQDCDC
ncbi:hypothetical protein CEXT_787381 [Caerostris extrusa]|uniref:Uncharacterized protein n=1 Tax=Caerostris extrusa TaxID=172846 RepID=A0AAV4VR90_CAEEX|nr:hypothetical protein CEXT_787381 [Caerostris extrusa]